jgi:6-phosphofructokinase 1
MRIGVFCSGGDAPGMNACVRSIVRSAAFAGHEVVGIMRGYNGLINRKFFRDPGGEEVMTPVRVANWAGHGGAHLRSSRCDEFRTVEGRVKAVKVLQDNNIDALIPIGGNGTIAGALELSKLWDGQIVACPGTIDNDLLGTDYTIGFSTAVETAVDAVDRIRDTASSHDRMFLVEVMGRHSGYIALYTALASGADVVAIPETDTNFPEIIAHLNRLKSSGRMMAIMIVAEGDEKGGADAINQQLIEHDCPFPSRTVVLGHLQRGGKPTPEDRRRAQQIGAAAVQAIIDGETCVLAGAADEQTILTPLAAAIAAHRPIPDELLSVLKRIAL